MADPPPSFGRPSAVVPGGARFPAGVPAGRHRRPADRFGRAPMRWPLMRRHTLRGDLTARWFRPLQCPRDGAPGTTAATAHRYGRFALEELRDAVEAISSRTLRAGRHATRAARPGLGSVGWWQVLGLVGSPARLGGERGGLQVLR